MTFPFSWALDRTSTSTSFVFICRLHFVLTMNYPMQRFLETYLLLVEGTLVNSLQGALSKIKFLFFFHFQETPSLCLCPVSEDMGMSNWNCPLKPGLHSFYQPWVRENMYLPPPFPPSSSCTTFQLLDLTVDSCWRNGTFVVTSVLWIAHPIKPEDVPWNVVPHGRSKESRFW